MARFRKSIAPVSFQSGTELPVEAYSQGLQYLRDRADKANIAMSQDLAELGAAPTSDIAEKQRIMNKYSEDLIGISDKYEGDLARASGSLARRIGAERINPYYEADRQRQIALEDQKRLVQQYGPEALKFATVEDLVSDTEANLGQQGRYRTEYGSDIEKKRDWMGAMHRTVDELKADSKTTMDRMLKDPKWRGFLKQEMEAGISPEKVEQYINEYAMDTYRNTADYKQQMRAYQELGHPQLGKLDETQADEIIKKELMGVGMERVFKQTSETYNADQVYLQQQRIDEAKGKKRAAAKAKEEYQKRILSRPETTPLRPSEINIQNYAKYKGMVSKEGKVDGKYMDLFGADGKLKYKSTKTINASPAFNAAMDNWSKGLISGKNNISLLDVVSPAADGEKKYLTPEGKIEIVDANETVPNNYLDFDLTIPISVKRTSPFKTKEEQWTQQSTFGYNPFDTKSNKRVDKIINEISIQDLANMEFALQKGKSLGLTGSDKDIVEQYMKLEENSQNRTDLYIRTPNAFNDAVLKSREFTAANKIFNTQTNEVMDIAEFNELRLDPDNKIESYGVGNTPELLGGNRIVITKANGETVEVFVEGDDLQRAAFSRSHSMQNALEDPDIRNLKAGATADNGYFTTEVDAENNQIYFTNKYTGTVYYGTPTITNNKFDLAINGVNKIVNGTRQSVTYDNPKSIKDFLLEDNKDFSFSGAMETDTYGTNTTSGSGQKPTDESYIMNTLYPQ